MPTNTQNLIDPKDRKKIIIEQILSGLPFQIRNILQKFSREILAGIIVIVLAVSLWFGYSKYTTSQENQAAAAMGIAMQQPDSEKSISALEKMVHQHRDTMAGKHALLILGAIQRDTGQFEAAKKSFNQAKKKFSKKSPLYQTALLGIGYLQENESKWEKARQSYKLLFKSQQGFETVATLDFARASSVLGHHEEALKAYNKYISMKPQSFQLDFVRYQIWKLSQHNKKTEG
jgi:predicted negative regulator of RcsB-dependent stress response